MNESFDDFHCRRASLREALDYGKATGLDSPKRRRPCHLQFDVFEQQRKTTDTKNQVLEQFFGRAANVGVSTSPAEIAALDHAIFQYMFAALKLLPDRVFSASSAAPKSAQ